MIKSLYPCFQHWSAKGRVIIISDTHFDDPDCKLMDENWITPEEHIKRLSFLTKNDTLIHLGDVGNPEYLTKLKCYKVLIMGNHDQSKTKFEPYFNEIYAGPLMIGEKLILSHEPLDIDWAFNIHGHNHNEERNYLASYNNHWNLASNIINYTYCDLGQLIKNGILQNTQSIHRLTIDNINKEHTNFWWVQTLSKTELANFLWGIETYIDPDNPSEYCTNINGTQIYNFTDVMDWLNKKHK